MARHREYREKIDSLLRNSVSQVLCDTGVHVLDIVLLFVTPSAANQVEVNCELNTMDMWIFTFSYCVIEL